MLSAPKPPVGRELWEPVRGAVRQQGLPVHSFVVEHEPGFVNQAWELVLQQSAVLVELDDEELLFVGGSGNRTS